MNYKEAENKISALCENLERVIRGKRSAIELSVAALLSRGHLLIEDVPGVGKTTLAHSIARSIDASFKRIQFTSDLLPSDVLGVTIYNQSTGNFEFKHGPIFANVVLADEINRATPKTQSALLQAMNEAEVSIENITYALPAPFFLLATQNPLDYAGTFPLPESQLDRFAMRIRLGYPSSEIEQEIITRGKEELTPESLSPVLGSNEVRELQDLRETVTVEKDLTEYIVSIVRATREHKEVRLGASPRGAMCILRSAQSLALIRGREFCTPDDIKAVAVATLGHRVITSSYGSGGTDSGEKGAEGDLIIEEILSEIKVPL
ncbi:MAG: MoxR family ATPase [Deltaproteobacteria bacterium]|nr:MoxR family ATPase [Deltaproteobacteria bacterium]